jgi:hypothetical protein
MRQMLTVPVVLRTLAPAIDAGKRGWVPGFPMPAFSDQILIELHPPTVSLSPYGRTQQRAIPATFSQYRRCQDVRVSRFSPAV